MQLRDDLIGFTMVAALLVVILVAAGWQVPAGAYFQKFQEVAGP